MRSATSGPWTCWDIGCTRIAQRRDHVGVERQVWVDGHASRWRGPFAPYPGTSGGPPGAGDRCWARRRGRWPGSRAAPPPTRRSTRARKLHRIRLAGPEQFSGPGQGARGRVIGRVCRQEVKNRLEPDWQRIADGDVRLLQAGVAPYEGEEDLRHPAVSRTARRRRCCLSARALSFGSHSTRAIS